MRSLVLLLVFSFSTGVAAQAELSQRGESRVERREEARRLFERGTEAHRSRRFTEAIADLRASLELYESLGTAFNLANALRGAARTSEAVTVFDSLLASRYGELTTEERLQAQALRDETFAELAVVRVHVDPEEGAIRIDGQAVGRAGPRGTEFRVDEGRHVVDARSEGHEASEREVQTRRGERRELHFVLEPIPTAEPSETRTRNRTWVYVVGAVAAAVGAGVAIAFAVRNRGEPFSDDEFGVTSTLRVGP